jgi:hypothetical protein
VIGAQFLEAPTLCLGQHPLLSIGGFLGVGSHMVIVPYDSLKFVDDKASLPGGTKDGLRMLPEFVYASDRAARHHRDSDWPLPQLGRSTGSRRPNRLADSLLPSVAISMMLPPA